MSDWSSDVCSSDLDRRYATASPKARNARPPPNDRGEPRVTDRLTELLAARGHLVADGAMGTNLFALGLATGESPELWNVEHPERVVAVHRAFLEAGSDIVLTNSRSEEHTSELQSLMRISYAVLCLKQKKRTTNIT